MLPFKLKYLGLQEYRQTWQAMQAFTDARNPADADEIWLLEHEAVFTLGRNGDPAHILNVGAIPVVESDRGGQVTYHGPGQLIVYPLLNLNRLKIGVRSMVVALENAVIETLSQYGIRAESRRDAPGVYVEGKKIASLGLRVRHGCTYHGLSVNVDLDLAPFAAINPCGYAGLEVTSLKAQGVKVRPLEVALPLVMALQNNLSGNPA